MIIGFDEGHTIKGPNYGAVGLMKESEETRVLGRKIKASLRDMEHTIVDCTVNLASSNLESLKQRVGNANRQKVDLFVSLHFNAGGGTGTEVFTYGGEKLVEAEMVLSNIEKLGFKNRGIKDGSHLYVVKNTKAPAMLIEICFLDTKSDVDLYRSKIDELAKAIADGINGRRFEKEENKVSKYDENPPIGANIIPGCKKAYIEETKDNRLIIHMDRGNYISIGKGECKIYLNDNNGSSKVHKLGL